MSDCFSGSLPAYSCIQLLLSLFVLCYAENKIRWWWWWWWYLSSGTYSTRSLTVQTWSWRHIHTHYIEWKLNNTLTRQLTGRQVFGCSIAHSHGGPSYARWDAISPSSSSESCCSCVLLLASCGLAWKELRTWLATDSAWYWHSCNYFCSCSCTSKGMFQRNPQS